MPIKQLSIVGAALSRRRIIRLSAGASSWTARVRRSLQTSPLGEPQSVREPLVDAEPFNMRVRSRHLVELPRFGLSEAIYSK